MQIEPLLDADQVATLLGVRRRTVYALIDAGFLPHVRLGKRLLRFRPEDVAAVAVSRRSASSDRGNE